jgi:uncharacterized membrane protein YedE/YeeE
MNHFTPVPSLLGGILIGIAVSLLLLTHGRVAGISGVYGGLFRRGAKDRDVRFAFVAGLVFAGLVVRVFSPAAFATSWSATLPLALVAGVVVGLGTQLGGGCTSGHGVCGVSRFSTRSIVATITFMGTGGLTVYVVRHVFGAGQ